MSSLAPSSCASTCGSSNAYAKGGRNAALLDNIIQCNGFAAREPAFKLFSKIATNILEHPTEIKYRKLNVEKGQRLRERRHELQLPGVGRACVNS